MYAPTRRIAEDLADRLVGEGIKAQAYHGGMAAGERNRRHEAFLTDEVPVMVATSGARLLKRAAVRALREELLPLAALVTPNLDETENLASSNHKREIVDSD